MKKTWIVVGMLAALFCAACDDNDNDKNNVKACKASDSYCSTDANNPVRYLCIDGKFVESPCSAGQVCSGNGVCSKAVECDAKASEASCDADGNVKYCGNGYWKTETCRNGFSCVPGGSRGAYCLDNVNRCVDGASRCNADGVHQVCVKDNAGVMKWKNDPCGVGKSCSDGQCVLGDICDKDGDTRCTVDGLHQICESNGVNLVWKDSPCATSQHCELGSCIDDDACVENERRCGSGKAIQICVKDKGWMNDGTVCNKLGADACYAGACVSAAVISDVSAYIDDVYEKYESNGGNNNNNNNNNNNKDKMYDCSTECYDQACTQTLGDICHQELDNNTFAVCADCSNQFQCASNQYASELIGADAYEAGLCGGGGGDSALYDCSNAELDNGMTAGEYCESKGSGDVALCADCSDYFGCVDSSQASSLIGADGYAAGLCE